MKKAVPFFLLFLLASASSSGSPPKGPPDFDLFGFKASQLSLPLNQAGKALTEVLSQKFQMNSFKKQPNRGAACLQVEKKPYSLLWYDSETEGFGLRLSVAEKTDCSDSEQIESLGKTPLAPSQFAPLSSVFPSLQFGVSTPASVQKILGKATFASSEKVSYALKRDLKKEKGCGYSGKNGDFSAIEIRFEFKKGVLTGIWLINGIRGEC
ncbi:MAG: hypothetical protein U1F57_03595 [bacterium]